MSETLRCVYKGESFCFCFWMVVSESEVSVSVSGLLCFLSVFGQFLVYFMLCSLVVSESKVSVCGWLYLNLELVVLVLFVAGFF